MLEKKQLNLRSVLEGVLSSQSASFLDLIYLNRRVVGQPSSVTSYVVLGDNAGPAKLKAIQKHGLKTLNEDEFLNLIATRKGVLDAKTKAKIAKEEKAIEEAAREMEKAERAADKATAKASSKGGSLRPLVDSSSQLWTTRYAPKQLRDICGNKQPLEKLQTWLRDWLVYPS